MEQAVFNFSPGPAKLPDAVLAKAQKEFLNWHNLQASVMEVSHRGPEFIELADQSIKNLRKLLNIPSNYQIFFFQGGAKGQFAAIPMNILHEGEKALYLNSGHWSKIAAQEAKKYGQIDEIQIDAIVDGKHKIVKSDFTDISSQYKYVHICSNETITGLEIFEEPKIKDSVLVADMSSNILSRNIDVSKYGIIYAGAQKNVGPAGITLVIVRDDLITEAQTITPTIWDFKIQTKLDSMYNTPPTFAWYLCNLVFEWLLEQGGLPEIEAQNKQKSDLLYSYIDNSDFYSNLIDIENRSKMNITFTTNNPELDLEFSKIATGKGLYGLKGHPVFGGIRASIYNAVSLEAVNSLIKYMQEFKSQHK